MKRYNVLKLSAVISYLVITFKGSMIAFPLGLCIIGWIVFPESLVQTLYSVGALAGLIVIAIMVKRRNTRRRILYEMAALILLILPIVGRMTAIPMNLFNYGAFIIPASSFIILYLCSLLVSLRNVLI
jgi:hypothetical protein